MMMKKVLAGSMVLALMITLITGCQVEEVQEYSKNVFALDTILSFKVYGGRKAQKALEQAIERIHEIEDRMSATKEDSDVGLINSNAGKSPVKVHDDTFYVIKKALEYGELTEGAFDITVRPIVDLWGITSEDPTIPTRSEIEEKLSLVDYRKVILDEIKKTVFLEQEGMGIDLGAIAKGYAADEAARILRKAGVRHALINMGGNVLVIGNKANGEPWRIGIQDPRAEETKHKHMAIVEVADKTIVSSGDYERYIVEVYEETGIRYHHIFDPHTGYPADTGLMACSIIASSSIDADALSTSVFIMGTKKGLAMVEKVKDVEGFTITKDNGVYMTKGLEGKLNITNQVYRIEKN